MGESLHWTDVLITFARPFGILPMGVTTKTSINLASKDQFGRWKGEKMFWLRIISFYRTYPPVMGPVSEKLSQPNG